jgi:CBS domain-containing protein
VPDLALPDPPVTGRVDSRSHEARERASLTTARVGDAALHPPFFVEGDVDLVSLCRMLSERGLTEALVRDGDRLGVFTTTDLRDALLRPEPPGRLPVRAVATFEPLAVSVDDRLFEALVLMLRHRVHRVIVRRDGEVAGLLSQLDLMAYVASQSPLIALQASEARDVASLKVAASRVEGLIRLLHEDGVRVDVIGGLVGELNRLIFRRLWELVAPEPLRAGSCLIVMGSEGRGEQIIRTDQDNALILRDDADAAGLEAATEAFTAALVDFGYPPCPGGVMVSRPLWRQRLTEFRATLGGWIHGSDPEGPMNLAIFLDAAPVAGDAGLLDAARAHVDRVLADSAAFFARFAKAVDQFAQDGSWWSRLPGLRGPAAAEVDIKKLGVFPIVHGVRALALQYRVRALGTAERLQALISAGRIEADLARDLIEALQFLIGLKLATNLRQLAGGRAPDNMVRLAELGTLERQALKDSLAIVRGFRAWLARHYRFDVLG